MLEFWKNHSKKIFFGISFLFFSLFLMFNSTKVGINDDSVLELMYAQNSYQFYTTFGKDTTYIVDNEDIKGSVESRYGNSFLMPSLLLSKVITSFNKYDILKFLVSILGVFILLFAFLISKKIFNDFYLSLFTSWCLFLTPMFTGLAFYQHKDVPFAFVYIASIFFIVKFIKQFPKFDKLTAIGLVLSFAFTIGIRVVGLLTVFYFAITVISLLFFYRNKLERKEIIRNIRTSFIIVLIAYVLGCLAYPYLISGSHFERMFELLTAMSKYPQKIPFIYDGKYIDSLKIPVSYVFNLYGLQLPIFILIGLILLVPFIYFVIKEKSKKQIATVSLLLFCVIFPLMLIVIKKSSLYDHLRHILFITVPLVIISAISIFSFYKNYIKLIYIKIAFVFILALLMYKSLRWTIKSVPYTSLYFNEIGGTFKKAGLDYQRDYSPISSKDCFEVIINDPYFHSKDKIVIITNHGRMFREYVKIHGLETKVKVIESGCRFFSERRFDYAYFTDIFLPYEVRKDYFPLPQSIFIMRLNGVPLACVVRKTDNRDYVGIYHIKNGNTTKGLELLEASMSEYPSNITLYKWLAFSYSEFHNNELCDNDKAIYYLDKIKPYQHFVLDADSYYVIMANINYNMKKFENAIRLYSQATQNSFFVNYKLALCYFNLKDFEKCRFYLDKCDSFNKSFPFAKELRKKLPKS